MSVDTQKYIEFVKETTSPPSLDYPVLSARLSELEANGANVTQLMTAALVCLLRQVSSLKLLRRLSSKANLTMKRMHFI